MMRMHDMHVVSAELQRAFAEVVRSVPPAAARAAIGRPRARQAAAEEL
eukprot:COSAG06_NODE_2395_length_6958_cov_4.127132_2_plen_48_part_00